MRGSLKNNTSESFRRTSLPAMACLRPLWAIIAVLGGLALGSGVAQAGIAYGSINNFDTVNDTGVPCHGFEIELDDIRSTDITYTYDWNHYGTPQITEDMVFTSGAWHTNVHVRYAAVWTNNAGWSAYTAVPTTNIPPTQGHAFTNPSLNFGGEHFGVGYRTPASAVKYNWLTNSGGVLLLGPAVNVATPAFTYIPPAGGPAQVQAAIVPPPPPVPDPLEFGAACWVKEIRTTSHNNSEVKLRELITPDTDTNSPSHKDWRNGEPDQVEVEWQILQVDHNSTGGGANGQLVGAPEDLPNGDEVITRRYEFYQYVGPLDSQTGEAMAQSVGPDGIHGTNGYETTVVVGNFYSAQMAGYDVAPPIGLIDHLPDGEVNTPYPGRIVVIAQDTNFTLTTSGALPDGMAFDATTGQVYGTPWTNGVFTFHVEASSSNNPVVAKTYLLAIAAAGVVLPPHSSVDTSASPVNGGTTAGDGVYTNGTTATVTAAPNAGYSFSNWTENGIIVSTSASYTFTNIINQSLVANFVPAPLLSFARQPNALVLTWPTNFSGFTLQQNSDLKTTNWGAATEPVGTVGTNYQATILTTNGPRFFRLMHP